MCNTWENIEELKAGMDQMLQRIRRAGRVAERKYEEVGCERQVKVDGQQNRNGRSMEKIVKGSQTNIAKLRRKRKLERKRRKVQACHIQYVGPTGTVKAVKIGEHQKQGFDIKCGDCGMVCTKLRQHLVVKHKYTEDQARFKESELRVMCLWAKKDKHSIPKPLPCALCNIWFLRLDNHLKYKHKEMDIYQRQAILKTARDEYWQDIKIDISTHSSRLVSKSSEDIHKKLGHNILKSNLSQSSSTSVSAYYVPQGSTMLSMSDKLIRYTEDEDFQIYYETSELLLAAFVAELMIKDPERWAKSYESFGVYLGYC